MKNILFLCTGNYYRSRYAEHLFNHLASKSGLDYKADSRALALERGINNVGAISHYTIKELSNKGINLTDDERFPQQAILEDFMKADMVIALDDSEHRPLMLERFPEWTDKIEYWLIHDVHLTSATIALGEIEKKVVQLIEELKHS